jgi:Flp pilus assembly protein TadD
MLPRAPRLFAATALAVVLALAVAGCKTMDDITGSTGARAAASATPAPPVAPRSEADWRKALAVWGKRYRENPGDIAAAIAYARALRATDQRAQAVAVLEQATMRHPTSMPLLGAYGRALADAGQYVRALDALGRAHTPDNPDWRILNAEGAVLDQMGRHNEAQRHYEAALKIVPGEPSVLSNLALSYALTKDLARAERTLRQAAADPKAAPKVRQNLALVVGLEGRFDEAERIASADLPPAEAEANISYLRTLLAQQHARRREGKPLTLSPDAGT